MAADCGVVLTPAACSGPHHHRKRLQQNLEVKHKRVVADVQQVEPEFSFRGRRSSDPA
jgi:hypothetical protein